MKDVRTRRAFALASAIAALASIGGCDLNNPGTPVPPARLNFPIAIALAGPDPAAPDTLLVANSNFDLRYASGTLQSFSIARITDAIDSHAGGCPILVDIDEDGVFEGTRPCELSDSEVAAMLTDEVQVGSSMDGIALSTSRDRVYLPVRSGSGRLTWVTVLPSGALTCDQNAGADDFESCDAAHRSADQSIGSARGESLPGDPVALAVGPLAEVESGLEGDYIVMAHRNGAVSLFLDQHTSPEVQPRYVDTLTGVPNDIVSIEADHHGLVWLTSGALASSRATRDLVAVEVVPTTFTGQDSGELAIAQRATLRGVDDGLDTRDIAVDPSRGADDLRLWVLARRPEAIITVDFALDPFASGEAPLGRIHPVGYGPSRLERFDFDFDPTGAGDVRPLLVATCYDARSLFVVDPEIGTLATVPGMSGPFEAAVDAAAGRVYVADFRFSVIWVVDIAPLRTEGSPLLLARLGSGHAPSVFR